MGAVHNDQEQRYCRESSDWFLMAAASDLKRKEMKINEKKIIRSGTDAQCLD